MPDQNMNTPQPDFFPGMKQESGKEGDMAEKEGLGNQNGRVNGERDKRDRHWTGKRKRKQKAKYSPTKPGQTQLRKTVFSSVSSHYPSPSEYHQTCFPRPRPAPPPRTHRRRRRSSTFSTAAAAAAAPVQYPETPHVLDS